MIHKYYQVEHAFSYYGGKPSVTGKTGVNLQANESRKPDTPVLTLLSRHSMGENVIKKNPSMFPELSPLLT